MVGFKLGKENHMCAFRLKKRIRIDPRSYEHF